MKKLLNPYVITIALFAGLGLFYIMKMGDNSSHVNQKQSNIVLELAAEALKHYQSDCGRLPTEAEGLQFLAGRDPHCPNAKEMYLKKMYTQDAWGNPIVYKVTPDGQAFDLVSFGQDGRPGGDGFDRDISWSNPQP